MPPRRSIVKKPSSVGKRSQQTKITDRNLRTIKKHNNSQQDESQKLVKSLDVNEDEHDNVKKARKSKRSMIYDIRAGIHQEHLSQVDILLRKFDLDYQFGPCVGLTRLERWNRAKKLGLNPPQEVKDVLDDTNKPCVFEL
ncbi:DNA polymerase delta, subunit 4-domain-containing protein [Circinella umbellata]|nr:DNA polymerase delta, subunit 4-domain-containing protein [Circinella umbellata]